MSSPHSIIGLTLSLGIFLISTTTTVWDYTQTVPHQIEVLTTQAEYFNEYAENEADWLISTQLENGALPFRPVNNGDAYINPYFSSNAALALIEYGSTESLKAARSYMEWHFSHMNIDTIDKYGLYYTIYDYDITLSEGHVVLETSSDNYDSADSYAALLLSLLCRYSQVSGDNTFALEHYSEFAGAIGVIESLMYEGLTFATPDYQICYLMDNCEVYAGLYDAAILLESIYLPASKSIEDEYAEQTKLLQKVQALRDEIYDSIENILWNGNDDHYEFCAQQSGLDWNEFYPDAIAQLSPIGCGLIEGNSERAQSLYTEFCEHYNWQRLLLNETDDVSFYWTSVAYVAALVKDYQSVAQYLEAYSAFALPERKYPFYNGESAGIFLAAKTCADDCINEADRLDPFHWYH